MDRASLVEFLDREHVDPRSYVIDSPNPDEQYALRRSADQWVVFDAERGFSRDERFFETEDEACADLLERVLRDPTTRRRD